VRAIDTNLVVRVLTDEQSPQGIRATRALGEGEIFVATTVLLECEWVLRSAYGFSNSAITTAFRGLAGLPNVSLEDAKLAEQALAWADEGMDLADAFHLASSRGCKTFLTFDQKLARVARRVCDVEVAEP
jgi:predicted nucleic-acid-binding protein